MALDLRLEHKMSQQLVMTPQLQQAIKLLQLSHLELADVLREELEQNPVLEEKAEGADENPVDVGGDEPNMELSAAGGDTDVGTGDGEGDAGGAEAPGSEGGESIADMTTVDRNDQADREPSREVSEVRQESLDGRDQQREQDAVREIDWESYLDSHSYSLPATAGSGPSEELPPFEATLTRPESLHEHLRWQIQMHEWADEDDEHIAIMLVEEINEDGYLSEEGASVVAEETGMPSTRIDNVIRELQGFDPIGVCARNLRECLLTQCQHIAKDNPLVERIVDQHLPDVERRNYQAISRALKVSLEEVGEAVRVIQTLEPRPGRTFTDKEPQYISPDIYVYKVGDGYAVVLNEDGLPKLRVSGYYRNALQGARGGDKSYIQEKLRSAAWLIRSIHMRQRTIYKVMESILKFQRDFFDKGVAHLKPLILKDVAEDVGMHESTISRVTTNKYVHTPQGIFELKYFFNSSISRIGGESVASESVRDLIKRLIDTEDNRHPLSDQQIVEVLKKQNLDIARRTVAKYRDMLKIPSSSRRKKVF